MQNKICNKKIIITGASSGIGERICWHVAKSGGIPIMLARSEDKLVAIQKQLMSELEAHSFIYRIDLQREEALDPIIDMILADHGQVHGLINNAGIGVFDYVKDMKWDDIAQMFRLNVFAAMQLSQRFIPHFTEHGEGHIINIISQAAKIATPKSAAYGASKHAILGFTNAMRQELSKENIFVTAVNLGPVRTNFFSVADPNGAYQKNVERYMLDPDKVAKVIVESLFKNKREINMPFWMEIGSRFYSVLPGFMEKILKGQFNKK
ncbi:SDR family NAD(P)-dependent oxidoreductase [Oceanobacillus damuensis]|uniref:SDR family NAD(P)-dependent oxidoreductase n=1 Tax=Oceanobacillus damuensis TaxID=937928 RepID=UPI0008349090|nr:SDR family oxidoreductase [Oceanobacillus damuensis]